MFGWRSLGSIEEERRRFGVQLEVEDNGAFLMLFLGRSTCAFVRYTANRLTGPEDNRSVLHHFLTGPERRRKTRDFRAGFAEGAEKARALAK